MQCRRWSLLYFVHHTNFLGVCFYFPIHPHWVIICLFFWLTLLKFWWSSMQKLSLWADEMLTFLLPADIPVVCKQVLHRNLQNITQEVACVLPFVPLKTLTELLNGETILRNVRWYGDIVWSPQQVRILYFYLAFIWKQMVHCSVEKRAWTASVFTPISLQLVSYASHEPLRILVPHTHQLPSN